MVCGHSASGALRGGGADLRRRPQRPRRKLAARTSHLVLPWSERPGDRQGSLHGHQRKLSLDFRQAASRCTWGLPGLAVGHERIAQRQIKRNDPLTSPRSSPCRRAMCSCRLSKTPVSMRARRHAVMHKNCSAVQPAHAAHLGTDHRHVGWPQIGRASDRMLTCARAQVTPR